MLNTAHREHPYLYLGKAIRGEMASQQAADKMVLILQLANHFHIITEHIYSHSTMRNFITRMVRPS